MKVKQTGDFIKEERFTLESFFTEPTSQAFAKVGIYGEAGSGKSTTASLFAIGLHQYIKSTKAIVYMDTETGSDWTKTLFKQAGIELKVIKHRSFSALRQVIPFVLQLGSDILIIDSVTHPHQDLTESYLAKVGRTKLWMQDFNILKPTWRLFTDDFVTKPLHIFACGRSQNIWGSAVDDETGKREYYVEGTRMKVDKEMGYEPSLLIEMEKVLNENWEKGKPGKKWLHRANILKDRNPDPKTTLEGKWFDDPTFENIIPHIEHVGIGREHVPVNIEDSQELFHKNSGKTDWQKEQQQKTIVLEEISGMVDMKFPTPTAKSDKVARLALSQYVFKTTSKEDVGQKTLEELQTGRDKIARILSLKENIRLLRGENPEEHLAEIKVPEVQNEPSNS